MTSNKSDGQPEKSRGTLNTGEPHPSAYGALRYVLNIPYERLLLYQESFASCAIEGSRLGEVCVETLGRVLDHRPVSDRYVMGLALAIWEMEREDGKSEYS